MFLVGMAVAGFGVSGGVSAKAFWFGMVLLVKRYLHARARARTHTPVFGASRILFHGAEAWLWL